MRRSWLGMLLVVILVFVCTAGARAQHTAFDNHKLAPDDELEITIPALPDQNRTVKIRSDGHFYMPAFGDVPAAGLTLSELRNALETRLSKDLLNPTVLVGLKTMAPQRAVVLGEVQKPGEYELDANATVVDLLAKAGGMNANANTGEATLVRDGKSTTISIVAPTPGSQMPSLRLLPGDTVYINAADKVSVTGEVIQPSTVKVSTGSQTVWSAIMAAGGPKPGAALSRVQLARIGQQSTRVLNLADGPSSSEANTDVHNGDTITVPVQHALVLGGTASNYVNLTGDDSLVEVVTRSGQFDQSIQKVALLRAADIATKTDKMLVLDLRKAITEHKPEAFTTVGDGDVLVITTHKKTEPLGGALNFINILTVLRTFGL